MRERKWDKIYVLIDVHDVIMKSNYSGASDEIFENCIYPLWVLSNDPRFCLIMWTCSGEEHIERYRQLFALKGIHFDYANENPEVTNTNGYGDYTKKMYANVILDDKAGFDHETDWAKIVVWLFLENIIDFHDYFSYLTTFCQNPKVKHALEK